MRQCSGLTSSLVHASPPLSWWVASCMHDHSRFAPAQPAAAPPARSAAQDTLGFLVVVAACTPRQTCSAHPGPRLIEGLDRADAMVLNRYESHAQCVLQWPSWLQLQVSTITPDCSVQLARKVQPAAPSSSTPRVVPKQPRLLAGIKARACSLPMERGSCLPDHPQRRL